MDIWFDSGISWSFALNGRKSHVFLEGKDQFGGWFQSSLLTSVAVGNGLPFDKILTHGFAVDENGKKMSKSVGNVVDPDTVLNGKNALGIDTLRWWVGSHSHNSLVPVSDSILKSEFKTVQSIRLIFRYLLGALNNARSKDLLENDDLLTLDKYLLNSCYNFYKSVMHSYNTYKTYSVCSQILHFVPNNVSSRYVSAIKDRLYCDSQESSRRKACLYTLNSILYTLTYTLAPILPHLVEEAFLHHPVSSENKRVFFRKEPWVPPEWWSNDATDKTILLLDNFKKDIVLDSNFKKMSCTLEVDVENFEELKVNRPIFQIRCRFFIKKKKIIIC